MTSAPVYEFRGRVPAAAAVVAAPLYRETIATGNGRRALITASPDYGPDDEAAYIWMCQFVASTVGAGVGPRTVVAYIQSKH